jgi:hypothetical protein
VRGGPVIGSFRFTGAPAASKRSKTACLSGNVRSMAACSGV